MALLANFTGTNETLVVGGYTSDSGATFREIYTLNTASLWKLYGGRGYVKAAGGNAESWLCSSAVTASADSTVEAVLYYLTGSLTAGGISVRTAGPGAPAAYAYTASGYAAIHSGGNWKLYYAVSGSAMVQIGSTVAQTLSTGTAYKVKLSAIGSTITLSTDNGDGTYVQRISVTDTHVTAAGAAGVYLLNDAWSGDSTTGYQIDSIAEQVPAATAVTLSGPSTGLSGVASSNFTVGANGAITGTVVVTPSDGGAGGTFTPTTVSISSGTPTGTFTYTPASAGAKTISVTNNGSLSNPSNITYTVSSPATAVTLTGPTSGLAGSASSNFNVGANGVITGTVVVTPSDGGAGGTFSPTTVSISSGTPTGAFTYTAASAGAKTISVTNNGGLSNPSNITYTASSATGVISMIGPSAGYTGTASELYTLSISGSISGTAVVTPSDGGNGGTFSPTTVSLSSGARTGTFTYTPASTGTKTISVTNNGGHTNPANLSYLSAASNGLVAPTTATLVSTTPTAISVSCNAPTGGTAPYTYEWHRDTYPGFSSGAHNLLASSNSLSITDTTSLVADTHYYYRCQAKDATGATVFSKLISAMLKAPTLVIGFIGDSITYGFGVTAGQEPPTHVRNILKKTYRNRDVIINNQGRSGTYTTDWMPGSSYLNTARTAFSTAGVTHVHLALGVNDATAQYNNVDTATYGSNLQAIINVLVGDGFKVILPYPTFVGDGNTGASDISKITRLVSYFPVIDSLVNNTTVLRGDTLAYDYFMANSATEYADSVHPNDVGALSLGTMWARGIDRAIFSPDRPVPTRTVTCTFTNKAGTPQANLTGLKWQWSDTAGNVIDAGTGATTNASGVFSITVHSYLAPGAIGFLQVTNAAGAMDTSYVSFAGPAAVS